MHHDFWLERWAEDRIGFHLAAPNPALVRYWPELGVPAGVPVLVPLCGKSHDVAWLAEAGHPVVGIELAERACAAFFRERGWVPAVDRDGLFRRYRSGDVTILEGDFFHYAPPGPVPAVYDRASMIALPPAMREAYAARIVAMTARRAQVLLLTLDYDDDERKGPPFAIPADEVRAHYGAAFAIERLDQRDLREADPERYGGARRMVEETWRLVRR